MSQEIVLMAGSSKAETSENLVIREIDGIDEIRATEQLQKEVWGLPDLDVVPSTQLIAAQAAGGVLIGAFDGDDLVGFIYGFAGYEGGRATHHSHMLAVKPAYRNFSLGYKLKLAQRDFVLAQGITEMTWTFDPLQSLNAHFNFERLGVISDHYLIDFYGTEATSFLHQNGTDRLWVTWQLASERVVERLANVANDLEHQPMTPLVELSDNNAPSASSGDPKNASDRVSIEIPAAITTIEQQNPELAAAWRGATRAAFTGAFAAGYVAVEFIRGTRSGKYILIRKI
jgi:predicted GNAT superfamily acetyltransferase